MLRSMGPRRNTAESQTDTSKPETKPVVTSKRRALHDITNAHSGEESKEDNAAKKPVLSTSATNNNTVFIKEIVAPSVFSDIREYMNRDSDDIDTRDANNPLLVTCYVNPMYEYFNMCERQFAISPTYMNNQEHVNERMRSILVDWLVSIILYS